MLKKNPITVNALNCQCACFYRKQYHNANNLNSPKNRLHFHAFGVKIHPFRLRMDLQGIVKCA